FRSADHFPPKFPAYPELPPNSKRPLPTRLQRGFSLSPRRFEGNLTRLTIPNSAPIRLPFPSPPKAASHPAVEQSSTPAYPAVELQRSIPCSLNPAYPAAPARRHTLASLHPLTQSRPGSVGTNQGGTGLRSAAR